MKINKVSICIFLLCLTTSFFSSQVIAQKFQSYEIFNQDMKKSKIKKLLKAIDKADVIFFGEKHNDPVSHWLQMKLLKSSAENYDVVLGLEMFEKDQQSSLDQYLQSEITMEELEAAIKLWPNYKTDYGPLIDFSKENNIKCIATNVPRRYASMVYKEGFEVLDGLVKEEKEYFAPLPIEYDANLPSYKKMLEMMEGHGGENFPKAQAIKDATMAHSISENAVVGSKFLHLNGSYHSDDHEGIVWHLRKYRPELSIVTISIITVEDGNYPNDLKGKADFIIKIDPDMTKSY